MEEALVRPLPYIISRKSETAFLPRPEMYQSAGRSGGETRRQVWYQTLEKRLLRQRQSRGFLLCVSLSAICVQAQ